MDSINNEDSQTDFYVDGIHYRVDNSGSGIIRPIFQIIDTHLCATDCESTGFIFAHSSRMNCTFEVDEERC